MPQPIRLPSFLTRVGSSFLGALLVVALAVTGVVTYRAHSSAREHRAIVERVINDYVAVASYQIGNSTRITLNSCLRDWFFGLSGQGAAAVDPAKCENSGGRSFALELAPAAAPMPAGLDPDLARWLRDTIPRHPRIPYDNDWQFGLLTRPNGDRPMLIGFAVRHAAGKPDRVVGVISETTIPFVMDAVLSQSRLLPPELTRGAADAELFDVVLATGRPATERPALYTRHNDLGDLWGGLRLTVTLRQAAVDRIVPGGLPKNRGFELFGLFALAVGLVASSLLLLRREAQLARTRSDFVSGVSHELRTPLTQIRMFAEMLLLGRVRTDADRRRSLEIIDKEARRLSQLVDNVLQMARSEHGAVRINPAVTKLAPIVRDAAESFLVLAQAGRIELRLELEERLVAPIDGAALRQILVNLLDNAAKYGPAGQTIVLGLALFGDTARLWVDDEGPGVAPRDRERVFEPFFRAPRALDSAAGGSGIGLAVVRELAVLHGGAAWVEDAPGAGARVVVEFPSAYVASEPADRDSAVA